MVSDHTWSGRAPLPSHLEVVLRIIDGPDKGIDYALPYSKIIIGRKKGDLLLNDREVSGIHATIEIGLERYIVKDLGSTNGTFLNGKRITIASIRNGSVIKVGSTIMKIEIKESESDAPSSPRRTEKGEGDPLGGKFPEEREPAGGSKPVETDAVLVTMSGNKPFSKLIKLKGTRSVIGSSGGLLLDVPAKGVFFVIERNQEGDYQLKNPAGTFELLLNGDNVLSKRLEEGDEVVLGAIRFKFLCGGDVLKRAREIIAST